MTKNKITHFLFLKIRNSEYEIKTVDFEFEDIQGSYNTLYKGRKKATVKFTFRGIVYGSESHILIQKLVEKGLSHGYLINNLNIIKNPLKETIPLIYFKNGIVRDHLTSFHKKLDNIKTGASMCNHSIKFELDKLGAYFIKEGLIEFDGDKKAMKDKNLMSAGLEIEKIGFENT